MKRPELPILRYVSQQPAKNSDSAGDDLHRTKTPFPCTDDIRHWFLLVPTWSFCSASELLSAWDFNCCTFQMLNDSISDSISPCYTHRNLHSSQATSDGWISKIQRIWISWKASKCQLGSVNFKQNPPPKPVFDKALPCDHQQLVILHHLQILLLTSHVASHVVSATLDAQASKLLRQYLISDIFFPGRWQVVLGCRISWVVNLQHTKPKQGWVFSTSPKNL